MSDELTPDEALDKIDYGPGSGNWMDTTKSVQIRPGMYCYAAKAESVKTLGLPNARPCPGNNTGMPLPVRHQESSLS